MVINFLEIVLEIILTPFHLDECHHLNLILDLKPRLEAKME